MGGSLANGTKIWQVWLFDLETNTKERKSDHLHVHNAVHGCAGKIRVGNHDLVLLVVYDNFQIYNVAHDQWSVHQAPQGLFSASFAVTYDNMFYLISGIDQLAVLLWDSKAMNWVYVEDVPQEARYLRNFVPYTLSYDKPNC